MAIIVYIKQKSEKTLYLKLSSKPIVIGRSRTCDVSTIDTLVSGRHCSLYLHSGIATIKDLGSTNGTLLNNCTIAEVNFFLSDVIKIGSLEIGLMRDQMTPDEIRIHTKVRAKTTLIDMNQFQQESNSKREALKKAITTQILVEKDPTGIIKKIGNLFKKEEA